ncbi:SRPBCC family protein [Halocalculus aciditolerans]|nr:SRPBCC family protein [Halocalculus aciditolerans]
MTVRVERTFDVPASRDAVWAFISDPAKRASAISVVDRYEDRGDAFIWFVKLPVIGTTVEFETHDVDVRENEYVKFEGKSRVANVVGEHELEDTEGGCRLTNRFVVQGKLPGVERFFEKNLDAELDRLERELVESVGDESEDEADGSDA